MDEPREPKRPNDQPIPHGLAGPATLPDQARTFPPGCRLEPDDLVQFAAGTHYRLYEKLGAHPATVDGVDGVAFSVWAPNARRVAVLGEFNDWDGKRHGLTPLRGAGMWSGFVPGLGRGALYKYAIESREHGTVEKSDPFALYCELAPSTASIVWELHHAWSDAAWMAGRAARQAADQPLSIYEMHLGSWRRRDEDPERIPRYDELADELIPYLLERGFTHVELMPVLEHPYYPSWGYQITGYFAATSRYGTPQQLMQLIDRLHQAGLGVILDWVPSHFPTDGHGLCFFDGTYLFEHADPRRGFHQDWKSYIFNYGRSTVRSFLISSALFWLERYHIDALRVDGVASMLYLDYSRKPGEWIQNAHGGREDLEAIAFLRQLNEAVHREHPGVVTIAEESTAWPMVSRPAHLGGLGFDMKWDMGWMHDTLHYAKLDPIHRKFHHGAMTFRTVYAWTENFVLALSHDEVVHGKGSLLGKMPGDAWQKFATLRALYGYMWAQPGKKLLFMGDEIGQWREWSHERGLDWRLLDHALHAGLARWVTDLNRAYRERPALCELDFDPAGFAWIDGHDSDQSVLCFLRRGKTQARTLLVVCNFTPVPRHGYRVGVPFAGHWHEILNSDSEHYGGSGQGNYGGRPADALEYHGQPRSLELTLPPLAVLFFEPESPGPPALLEAAPEAVARTATSADGA